MTTKRPIVAVSEYISLDGDTGIEYRTTHREMDDAEFKQYKADVARAKKEAKAEAARPHPLVEQIAAMSDDERRALKEALDA